MHPCHPCRPMLCRHCLIAMLVVIVPITLMLRQHLRFLNTALLAVSVFAGHGRFLSFSYCFIHCFLYCFFLSFYLRFVPFFRFFLNELLLRFAFITRRAISFGILLRLSLSQSSLFNLYGLDLFLPANGLDLCLGLAVRLRNQLD